MYLQEVVRGHGLDLYGSVISEKICTFGATYVGNLRFVLVGILCFRSLVNAS
jgi:hypothetical protein